MRKYETIFVIDSLLKSEEIDSIINKYERFISANGGQIETIERWGKKRLAHEIKKRQYGFYVLIRFDGPPTMIKTLEREYRLNESLLRYKTLVMHKFAINALGQAIAAAKPAIEQPVEVTPAPQPAASETPIAEEPAASETPIAEEPAAPEAEQAATEPEEKKDE